MLVRFVSLLALIIIGAVAAAGFARHLESVRAERLARKYLIAVVALIAARIVAYVAANVFGIRAVRPLSTGPFDLTNLVIGALYGLGAVHRFNGGFNAFWRTPELLLALRIATGVAFVLAGLVNAFTLNAGGTDYFVQMGYTKTFHLFIMTAEVLGGAALLLPWRWLTLAAAMGLAIDMFGALFTQYRAGAQLDAAAFAMLFRLAPLVTVAMNGRWAALGMGALASAVTAIAGALLLHQP